MRTSYRKISGHLPGIDWFYWHCARCELGTCIWSLILLPVYHPPTHILPVHIHFYPSKLPVQVDGSLHKATMACLHNTCLSSFAQTVHKKNVTWLQCPSKVVVYVVGIQHCSAGGEGRLLFVMQCHFFRTGNYLIPPERVIVMLLVWIDPMIVSWRRCFVCWVLLHHLHHSVLATYLWLEYYRALVFRVGLF